MIEGVIFDFNGVIIDDYLLQKEVWSRISEMARNRPVTDEEMTQNISWYPHGGYDYLDVKRALSSEQVDELARKKSAITKELFDSDALLQLTPGFRSF